MALRQKRLSVIVVRMTTLTQLTSDIDEPALRQFLTRHKSDVPIYVNAANKTFSLITNSEISAFASISTNAFHPQFLTIDACTDNADALDTLLTQLLEQYPNQPLQIKPNSPQHYAWQEVLNRHGFVLTVICDCPEIDVAESLADLADTTLPTGMTLHRCDTLSEQQQSQLQTLRIDGYIETHAWSPPVETSNVVWAETKLNTVDRKLSYVVYENDEILLFSDLHDEDEEMWLGWSWHSDKLASNLTPAWSAVLKKQLLHCANARLFAEVDSTDKYSRCKLGLLVPKSHEKHHIYQRR